MNSQINLKHNNFEPSEPAPVRSPRRRWLKPLLLVLALVLVGKGIFLWRESRVWRAVFLVNNQVYFGHFVPMPFASTITLKDIYYLQVNQGIQTQDGATQPAMNLVKLGEEIHAPEDRMTIPRSQILYWENLKGSGAVVQAIQKYQAEHR
jgi:hypothetical protein